MMLSLVFDSTSDLLIRCLRAVVAYLDVSVYVCVYRGELKKKYTVIINTYTTVCEMMMIVRTALFPLTLQPIHHVT